MLHNMLRAAAGRDRIPTDGLIAHYTMDNISGTTLVDEMGNYDGTLNGTFTSTTGIGGTSALFADSTSSYISIPNLGSWFADRSEASISFWVKPNTDNAGVPPQFCVSFSIHDTPYYLLQVEFTPTVRQRYCITSLTNKIDTSITYSTATFHHIAVVFSGGAGKVFVNNSLINTISTAANMPAQATSTAMLGRIPAINSTSNAQRIHQCQMRIYNKSLDNEGITQLYSEGA